MKSGEYAGSCLTHLSTQDQSRRIASSNAAWATESVPGLPEFQSEIRSQNKANNEENQ